jgi:hypothetical protein
VYAGDLGHSGTVSVERGNCTKDGGTFVDGTIDGSTFVYNATNSQLTFAYSNGEAIGAGVIGGVSAPPDDPLPPGVGTMLGDAGNRASRDLNTSMGVIGAMAVSWTGGYLGPAAFASLIEAGELGAVGPGVALLKLAQRYGLSLNSEKTRILLANLDTKVEDFVGKYRLGSIKQAAGWKFDGMTVREALDAGGRKLLTDGRFDKR